jgi:uncharacterized integral membrane protein
MAAARRRAMADDERAGGSPARFNSRQIATVVAAFLLIWFAIANWQRVEIHFWIITVHAALTLVIAVSAVLGGFVVLAMRRRRGRRED